MPINSNKTTTIFELKADRYFELCVQDFFEIFVWELPPFMIFLWLSHTCFGIQEWAESPAVAMQCEGHFNNLLFVFLLKGNSYLPSNSVGNWIKEQMCLNVAYFWNLSVTCTMKRKVQRRFRIVNLIICIYKKVWHTARMIHQQENCRF